MSSERLIQAVRGLSQSPATVAASIPNPRAVARLARAPFLVGSLPGEEQLARASMEIAGWLAGRGPAPKPTTMDYAPLLQELAKFLKNERFRTALRNHLNSERRPKALIRLIDLYHADDRSVGDWTGPWIAQNVDRHQDTADYAEAAKNGLFEVSTLAYRLFDLALRTGDLLQALAALGPELAARGCALSRRILADFLPQMVAHIAQAKEAEPGVVVKLTRQLVDLRVIDPITGPAEFVQQLASLSQNGSFPTNRRLIHAIAIGLLGDPATSWESWRSIEGDTQRLMSAWAPRPILELAFSLTREMDESVAWKEKFWNGLLDQGVVDGATLALVGPLAEEFEKDPRSRIAGWCVSSTSESLYPNAILIMKAGSLTVAEPVLSGSCRIWLGRNRAAPPLASERYDLRQLKSGADYEQIHKGSRSGLWQSELVSFLIGARVHVPDPNALTQT